MANPKTKELVVVDTFEDTARFMKGEAMDDSDNRIANVYIAKSLLEDGKHPSRIKLVAEYD
jgi:hypothetical protein